MNWPHDRGWMCPNCGSAHPPSVTTCPVQMQASPTTIGTNVKCHACGLWPTQTCSRQPCLRWAGHLSTPKARAALSPAQSALCAICDQIKELHPNTHPWTARKA